ncbi:AraC family transcriptional regulator [Rathayibacter sp. SD072]|uniref:AraC family transcriptional regulator n=1 Tax=Rathayibacter sp. SD072 TaxID=2781731 RepID=UPI001A97339A|nr:AraC family transcriptional regulator [Rathayibacter sp. SD072]MBO0984557.1 AraC family transcriptional regulator [Rathayibacter sp. SD072]
MTDGFLGQRLRVLPAPLVQRALTEPITDRLLVTDAGHFPHALAHSRSRPSGAEEAIVILCTAGRGRVRTGEATSAVASGQAVVIPASVPHHYGADPADPWSIWWLHVRGADAPALVEAVLGGSPSPVVPVGDAFAAKALIEQAVLALERDETASSLYRASGAAFHLLAQLAADRSRGPVESGDRIRLAQEHLREHFASPTSLTELAALAGLSPSHFSALFTRATGLGAVEYVKRLRSARARELLVTTDDSVAEIARAVGYSDAFYFSRQFRAVTGTSPSQYRADYRAQE